MIRGLHHCIADALRHLAERRLIEQHPQVRGAIAKMDTVVKFMTRRDYITGNSMIMAARRPLVIGLWAVLIISVFMLIWGLCVPIESAAIAKGTVVLLSNRKSIQHLEGGIIEAILVHEGDRVMPGQPLIRLNDTAATSNRDVLEGQLYVARASEARLIALVNQSERIIFDQDMRESSKTSESLAKAMSIQAQLFASVQNAQKTKLSILNQEIVKSEEEINGLKSQMAGVSGQIAADREEEQTTRYLLKKGYDTRTHLLKLQSHQDELKGRLGQLVSDVAETEQNIAELKLQILNQQNDYDSKYSKELGNVQAHISDLRDKLREAKDVVARTVISAPTGGIVTGLKYHTIGGVIAPRAQIMDIVPQDDLLVIEAHLRPTDISDVHAGLDAKVIFTSYKTRTIPKVPGKVTQISADIFSDRQALATASNDHGANPDSYYTVRIVVDKSFIQSMTKPVELYPGMPAEVLIRTGSRSFLGYLFRPVTDSMQHAFREK